MTHSDPRPKTTRQFRRRRPAAVAAVAAGLDRRLPRAGDVPDDGRGAQSSARWPTKLPGQRIWELLCHHQSHVEWVGCSLHDLIQPSFSFLVGVALPFSLAGRLARGQSKARMTAHALWRSLVLVLLGVFLRSRDQQQTYFTFEDTLSQIGLGYTFLFVLALLLDASSVDRAGLILVGYWAAFALYPAPGPRFRLRRGRGSSELAAPSQRVRRPLGQEQQPGLGVSTPGS